MAAFTSRAQFLRTHSPRPKYSAQIYVLMTTRAISPADPPAKSLVRYTRIIDRNIMTESAVHKGSVPERLVFGVGALNTRARQEEPCGLPFVLDDW